MIFFTSGKKYIPGLILDIRYIFMGNRFKVHCPDGRGSFHILPFGVTGGKIMIAVYRLFLTSLSVFTDI